MQQWRNWRHCQRGMVALVLFISLLVSILPSGDSRRRVASEAELQNRFSVRPRDFRFRHKLNSTCQFWKDELSHRNIDVHNVMDSINDTLSQIEEQLVRIKSIIVSTKALVTLILRFSSNKSIKSLGWWSWHFFSRAQIAVRWPWHLCPQLRVTAVMCSPCTTPLSAPSPTSLSWRWTGSRPGVSCVLGASSCGQCPAYKKGKNKLPVKYNL